MATPYSNNTISSSKDSIYYQGIILGVYNDNTTLTINDGDKVLVGSNPINDFSGYANYIAIYSKYITPSWTFIQLQNGMEFFNQQTQKKYIYQNNQLNETSTGANTFSNLTPMYITLGGYENGTTFNNQTMQQMWDGLLYPYVSPIISLSSSPNGEYLENGTNITNIQLTVSITKKSNNIIKVEYYKNGNLLYIDSSPNASGGSDTYKDISTINSTTSYYAKVYDDKPNNINTNIISFNFIYPMYIGSLTTATPTQNDVTSMTKLVVPKGNQSFNYTINNSYFCFAFPTNYASNLSSIKDPNNFEIISTFNITTSNFTMLDGTSQNYTIYTSQLPTTQTNFNVTYIF
ncbi:DUF2793 domain-containing protein [Clostridium sp.]|uniref:DUF2793 domain-containing protein n=1 Tax=Clostridium sp. TaxID=1506 RepID=UPI00260313AF|nr:DUF2793 domain-containing protein [Clostridium sp.]